VYNHGGRFGAAEPELKLGISPAKKPKSQRSQNSNKQFFKIIYLFPRKRDYEKSLAEALRLSDYENLIRQRDEARQRGELVGVVLSTFVPFCFLKITSLRESNRSRGLKV